MASLTLSHMLTTWQLVLLLAVALLILCVILYVRASGVFYRIKLRTDRPRFGALFIAYKFHQDSYARIKHAFKAACAVSPSARLVGVYYDDPKSVEAGKQRYLVGAVLNDEQGQVDRALQMCYAQAGYKTVWLPEIEHAVLADFPFATVLSVIVGIWRVYPRIEKFIKVKFTEK